jgi:hypothetical protein
MEETIQTIEDAELLAIRARRIAIRRKRLQLVRENGLLFYKPHAKQDSFHRAGAKFKKRMVRAGNRFGKSHLGCSEDCAWVLNERVWYPEGDPARRGGIPQRPVKGLIITTDWDKVREIWTEEGGDQPGKLWSMLPKGFVKQKNRNHSGAIDYMLMRNGSVLRFDTVKSFMTNPQGAESSNWDFIHVDEPCPQKMFKAHARGLIDTGGSFWFTLTPLAEFWINDLFFPQETDKPRNDIWAVDGSIYDNPHLSAEDIESYASLLSDDEKDCRLYGIPMHLTGLIYKEFAHDRHVRQEPPIGWKDWLTPPDNWTIYVQIDVHPRTPHAVLFLAVSPFGHHYYYNDLFVHCTIPDLVKKIRELLQGRIPTWFSVDPLAFVEYPKEEIFSSMADEFAAHGMPVEKAPKNPAFGILEVKKQLKLLGQIQFSPECRRTLWEIRRWCWDEDKNKPMDVDDHMMENLYRMEISNCVWIDPEAFNREIKDETFVSAAMDLEDVNF